MRFLSSSPDSRKFVLLAPPESAVPTFFKRARTDPNRYDSLLTEMQRLRGRLYLQDGAIEPGELNNGRHQLDIDQGSWHLLVMDKEGRVSGCMRYSEYSNEASFSELSVSHSALAHCAEWGG